VDHLSILLIRFRRVPRLPSCC